MAASAAIPKVCPICRKANTNKTGYCDVHEAKYLEDRKKARAMFAARFDKQRGSPSSRGYDHTWNKVRKNFLMQFPLCAKCMEQNRIMPAREVHHIKAISEGGARFDFENLMSLCRACHQKITEEQLKERRKNIDKKASAY